MKLDSSNEPQLLPQQDQSSVLRLGFINCRMEDWIFDPYDLRVFADHKLALDNTSGAHCHEEIQSSALAQREFHDYLLRHLLNNPRLGYRRQGNELIHEKAGLSWNLGGRRLWLASLWLPEDICLLEESDGRYCLTAASVCSPSNWHLEDKIGKSVDFIHAPVPGYEAVLSARVNKFLSGLADGRVMLRYNWSVQEGNELYWRGDGPAPANAVRGTNDSRYWRIERQTFLRLPESGAIIFGIRIFLHSFKLLCNIDGFERALDSSLAALPMTEKVYKGLGGE